MTQEEKQLELGKRYLKMAQIWATNSYAIRRKVGCLIVKDSMIISDGVNGTIPGFSNSCEYVDGLEDQDLSIRELKEAEDIGAKLITKDEVIHAEMNALAKVAKSTQSCDGATVYVTLEPCQNCAKHLIMSGIKRVVYADSYHIHDGIKLLRKANIKVEQIEL